MMNRQQRLRDQLANSKPVFSLRGESLSGNVKIVHDDQQQRQGIGSCLSSTRSTFAARVGAGGGERRERMGVTARIGVAMGEVRVGASRRTQQLRERMKWLGDEAKRWLWRDAG